MHCYIIFPLFDKPPTAGAKLYYTSGDTHSQKGTYNTSFIAAASAYYTFQITEQDPV